MLVLSVLLAAGLVSRGCELSADVDSLPAPPEVEAPDAGEQDAAAAAAAANDAWQPVCTPGAASCERLRRKVCSADGDGWAYFDCPPGAGCVTGGACELAHPRILFIFDTSSSMLAPADGAGGIVEPTCGSIEAEGSRIAASKALFRLLFAAPLATEPRMALFRFPQRAEAAPACEAASYYGQGQLSGDDGSHRAPTERADWFRRNLRQVLIVPFRGDPSRDGREEAARWLDGEERALETAAESCATDADCGDRESFCSGGVCYRLVEPELRAAGSTPLGKTLFYAGEYYQQLGFPDGRGCDSDASCGSPGYRCGDDGQCYDPLESCRTNHIVVFSDGAETGNPEATDFFHPVNQARRFRYGLGCARDEDCLAGATCGASRSCVPPGEAPTGGPDGARDDERIRSFLDYVDPLGEQGLRRRDGRPVSVQLHFLDVWGQDPANALLAWMGGGSYVTGSLDDPEAVLYEMDVLFRSKAEERLCLPSDD